MVFSAQLVPKKPLVSPRDWSCTQQKSHIFLILETVVEIESSYSVVQLSYRLGFTSLETAEVNPCTGAPGEIGLNRECQAI